MPCLHSADLRSKTRAARLILLPVKVLKGKKAPRSAKSLNGQQAAHKSHAAQSNGAAVLSGTGNLRENPAAFPCQENAPLLPHCQCKALCRQPAGRGPRPESLPEQGEQGKATCELLLGPVQGQDLGCDDPYGIFSDSLIAHFPTLEESIFQGRAPGAGSCARGCCSPAHLKAQGALCPPSTPQPQNIPKHSPELGVSHRARWNWRRKTHIAPKETEGAFSVWWLGTEFELQAPAMGFSLQKKMAFPPPGEARTRLCSGGLSGGSLQRKSPGRINGLLINSTMFQSVSAELWAGHIQPVTAPKNFSLQNKDQNQLILMSFTLRQPSPVWSLLGTASDTNNGQEPSRGAEN